MAQTQNQASRERQIEALKRALGHDLLGYLQTPNIVEIMLNPDGELWVDVLGGTMERVGAIDPVQSRTMISACASMLGVVVNPENPILECELPLDGSRFEALIPPLVSRPTFTIRKKALLIFTLWDYVDHGIMTWAQKEAIEVAVRNRENILVAGGTGSGKTTLANAILHAVSVLTPEHRIVVIEDTLELQCSAPNAVFLRTSINTDMTRLLRATMRLRPDRIVVGEVRDGAALALIKAWNTGHPGGAGTVHANSAEAALVRVGQLIQEAGVSPVPELIAAAVNVVVFIKRTSMGRIVDEIVRVNGFENGGFVVANV